jgi:hypothetical protein
MMNTGFTQVQRFLLVNLQGGMSQTKPDKTNLSGHLSGTVRAMRWVMKATCIDCGGRFYRERGQTWKKRCMSCWMATQASRPAASDDLADELESWKTRAHLAEMRLSLGAQFDMDELKALRRLCHPDKHGGSDTATRLSQRINAMIRGA